MRRTSFAVATAVARALTTTPLHDVTPLVRSAQLSNKLNCDVFFKMDCAQPPGSFKLRGIGATVKEAVENGADGVVSSSGGNAGLATAHAARALGIACTVVLPTTTPDAVRRKLEDEYGAEVIVEGNVWDEANERAKALAAEYKRPLVHPFEGETTWKGHSTLVQEVDEQLVELGLSMDAIVCCVGGGGLLAGVLRGVGTRDDCAIVAAEHMERTRSRNHLQRNAGDDPYYLNRQVAGRGHAVADCIKGRVGIEARPPARRLRRGRGARMPTFRGRAARFG